MRASRIPDPPPSMPSPGPLQAGKSSEVRAAEIIAAALLEVAKSVDRLTEAVKNGSGELARYVLECPERNPATSASG